MIFPYLLQDFLTFFYLEKTIAFPPGFSLTVVIPERVRSPFKSHKIVYGIDMSEGKINGLLIICCTNV